MPSNEEHIKQVVLGSGMLSLVGIRINPFPPEPSFLFQAEILGHKLSRLGRLAKELYMKYVCVCVCHTLYIHTQ